jgi:hypothetical protein
MSKQELTRLRISFTPNLLADPERAPEMAGNDVSQELVVGNWPTCHGVRWRTLEPLVINPVITADTGTTARGTVRRGVQSDGVTLVGELEEGNTIPTPEVLNPPHKVQTKILVQWDNSTPRVAESEGVQHSGQHKPAGPDHFAGKHELPDKRLQLPQISFQLVLP